MDGRRCRLHFLAIAVLVMSQLMCLSPGTWGKPIEIDGDFSDWTGEAPSAPHTAALSAGEWIYLGTPNDARTDLPWAEGDNDILEMRLTRDSTRLYLYFHMRDIDDPSHCLMAIALDTDQNDSDNALTWIGPDTDLALGHAGQYAERQICIHNVLGETATQIELYAEDGSDWYVPPTPGWAAWINPSENRIEAGIPLADLGIDENSVVWITTVTCGNDARWADDLFGTSADILGTHDALDVVTENTPSPWLSAWDRDLNDGDAGFSSHVDLSLLDVFVPEWGSYMGVSEASRRSGIQK